MDPDRIRNAAMGRKSSGGDPALRRRLLFYGFIIVVILLWWSQGGEDVTSRRATEPLGPVDVPVERPPLARVDRSLLAGVKDATPTERAVLEPEARSHLLREAGRLVYGDLEKLGLEHADRQALMDDPASHRGDAVWVRGTLSWTDSELIDGYLTVRGAVEDDQGQSWNFLMLTAPPDIAPGDVVKVQGFFLKLYAMLAPDRTQVTAPLIVGDELLRSAWPIEPVTSLPPGLLDDVRDYDLAQASHGLNSPEYFELLSYVNNAPEQTLFGDQPPPEVLPTQILNDPGHWRGRPVHVTGVLTYMRKQPLGPRGENPLGVPFAWELWVSDNRAVGSGTMLLISLTEPKGLKQNDIVEADGLFFRRYAFENKRNRPHMAAVILPRDVLRFVPEPDALAPLLMRVIGGLVIVFVLLFLFGSWRDRRAAASARTQRMRRKRRLVGLPGLLNRSREDPPEEAGTGPDQGAGGDPAPERGP